VALQLIFLHSKTQITNYSAGTKVHFGFQKACVSYVSCLSSFSFPNSC
jgi:hypothetical protein